MTRNISLVLLLMCMNYLAGCKLIRQAASPANVEQTPKTEVQKAAEKRSLAPFAVLEGTPYRIAAVNQSWGKDRSLMSSSSYDSDSTRNYIFLNAETRDSIKLLPTSDGLLTRFEKIGKTNAEGKLIKVEALWYLVTRSDSNGDKRLDYQDKKTVATSAMSGEGYTELIPQVDRVLNTFQSGPTQVLMVYQLDTKYFVAQLDLGTRKLLETKELPNLE